MDDDLGLRERKKRETRTALSRTAFTLCLERGVDAVTIADIAAGANVSPRTFFNYFSSKEEAILGGADRIERLVALLAARPDDEPLWDAVRAAVGGVLEDEQLPQRELLAQARLAGESPSLAAHQLALWTDLEQHLVGEVARRTGASPDQLHPRLVVATVLATIRVAVDHWIDTPNDLPLVTAVDDALVMARDGLHDAELARP